MDDLKNCPFCGSTTAPRLFEDDCTGTMSVLCDCIADGCGTESCANYDKAEAIAAWNRRPTIPSLTDAEIKLLCKQHLIQGDHGDYLEDDGFHLVKAVIERMKGGGDE